MDVALFITCLTDTFHPRVGIAVVRVLRHLGCKVHFPPGQTCCGQPAYNNGFHKQAAAMGRRMVDVFDGDDYVVTPSASCATMVKHHTPELLADDPAYADRARRLAERTWEFSTFLTDVLAVNLADFAPKETSPTTFHYSCHTRKIQPPQDASRLVHDLCRESYRPLEDLDQCCGFGGAFSTLFPNISHAMAGDKIGAIERSGADVVVCNEAGCTMTLAGAVQRRGINVTFKHLADLLAESLGLMDEEL